MSRELAQDRLGSAMLNPVSFLGVYRLGGPTPTQFEAPRDPFLS
jgi:hypothetical protein